MKYLLFSILVFTFISCGSEDMGGEKTQQISYELLDSEASSGIKICGLISALGDDKYSLVHEDKSYLLIADTDEAYEVLSSSQEEANGCVSVSRFMNVMTDEGDDNIRGYEHLMVSSVYFEQF